MEHTEKLRDLTIRWKNSVGASYDDMADIFNCSKSHLYEFLKRKTNIGYELGMEIRTVVTFWGIEDFITYKVNKTLNKRKIEVCDVAED